MRSIAPQLLILVAAVSALAGPGAAGGGDAELGTPTASDPPVLEYQRHLIHGPDPGPRLAIFESGRIEVHYPVFMKKAGSFELYLSPQELHQIFFDLEVAGFQAFDDRRAVLEQQAAEAHLKKPISPGGTWTLFRWRPFSADAHGELSFRGEPVQEIRWQSLARSILTMPESDQLQRLSTAHRRLERLMADPRLEPAGAHP